MNEIGMTKATLKFLAKISAPVLIAVTLVACGGGKKDTNVNQGQEVDIDQLLGSEEQPSQQSSDEDEVLRLLGITPDKPEEVKGIASTEPAPMPPTEPAVDQMQRELQEKNQMISALQADVSEKDRRIQALQSELERAQRTSGRMAGDYAQRYAQARALYESRSYREAINAFAALLAENDKNSLADNCQYWIGECYYGLGNYAQSIVEFEKIFTFPRSDKNDDSHLKIGLCHLRMNDRQQARSEFEQLLATYPNSEYAGKARNYLSKL